MRSHHPRRFTVMFRLSIALLLLVVYLKGLPIFLETSLGQGFALIWGTFLFVIILAQVNAYRLIQKRKQAETNLKRFRMKRPQKRFQRSNLSS